jgi:hypothetical protein
MRQDADSEAHVEFVLALAMDSRWVEVRLACCCAKRYSVMGSGQWRLALRCPHQGASDRVVEQLVALDHG